MRAGIDDLSDLPGVVIGVSRGRPDADDATRSRTERAKQPAPRMAARQFHSPAQLLGVLNCLLDRRFWVSWSGHRRILRLTVDKCQANPIFFVFRPLLRCPLSIVHSQLPRERLVQQRLFQIVERGEFLLVDGFCFYLCYPCNPWFLFHRTTRFQSSFAFLKFSSSARARSVMFRYPSICAMCVSLNAVTTLGSTITN